MIFEQEIKKERQQKWHLAADARPLRTLDDAREFLNSVGFCLAYPVRPAALAPTFIGAYVGSEEKLPTAKQAFADENARAATELVVRLLSEKSAFEVAFGEEGSLLVSAAEFPYFYALVGDRNPKAAPSPGPRGEQALTTHTFQIIDEHGPINEDEMRRKLGREISRNAIEKVLHTLWSKLRITRVDTGVENGEPVEPVWDMMHRFAADAVNRGKQVSAGEALSALISKYLETVVAAEKKEIEDFFGHLIPRSKVAEVCKAMLSAQEFTYIQVSGKTMLQLASRGADAEAASADRNAPAERKLRPWQAREQGKKVEQEKRARFAPRSERPTAADGGVFQKFNKDRKSFGDRKPFGDKGKPFGERKAFGERKSFSKSSSFGERPKFSKDRPPREAGAKRDFKKPFADRAKPFGPRKSFGESGKAFSDRKAFAGRPRFAGSSGKRPGTRPGARSGEVHLPREANTAGEIKKTFAPRGGFKKPFASRGDFPKRKPFADREGKSFGAGKSFGGKNTFSKPFSKPSAKRSDVKRKSPRDRANQPPWLREKNPGEKKPGEGSSE